MSLEYTESIEYAPENDPEREYAKLAEVLRELNPQYELQMVRKAFELARDCHSNQKRMSGEPYIIHPLQVAQIVATLKLDPSSIVAALLHDVVEDTACTLEDIEQHFGREIAALVDGLTKIAKIEFRSSQERLAENFRKMILAMAKDLRVILIKLADRLHNMRTISALSEEKRRRIAQETLDIYAPLANRLGIYSVKSELEDLCLRYLKGEFYQEIRSKVAAKKSVRQAYIQEVKSILELELKKYGFKDAQVYGRPKHFFSIYKKMVDRHVDFENIHDLFAFRIIVGSVKDCYEALGVIHAMWKPMPGRFKDYIAMPKANLYQSLHTTVVRPNGDPAEIQIRTREMHEISELGVAAHWSYKEKGPKTGAQPTDLQKFAWLRQIMQWQNELTDPDEFLEAVKIDLFDEEIFVFTPKGDVISLPVSATALDFAFAVHTDIGIKTTAARVNSRIVPLKKTLESGDIIEILTSNQQKPTKDWLNYVVTSKARSKIRSYLRTEDRDKAAKLGRTLLQQEIQKRGLDPELLERDDEAEKIYRNAHLGNLEDLYRSLGYGKMLAKDLLDKIHPEKLRSLGLEEQAKQSPTHKRNYSQYSKSKNPTGVLVAGYDDVLVTISACCQALPGDLIVGFVTRSRGVSVHRSHCTRALDVDPDRRIEVSWAGIPSDRAPEYYHPCQIRVLSRDRNGVLAEVTGVISATGATVRKAEVKVSPGLTGICDFELGIKDVKQLEILTAKLEAIPAVIEVTRRFGSRSTRKKASKNAAKITKK